MFTFDDCFAKVVGHEGGYGSDPRDRGNWTSGVIGVGACKGTKYGVSAAAYPDLDILNLTLGLAQDIYRRDYWDKLRCDDLPGGLRYYLFDTAVNCGVAFAAESLQRAAGVLPDGQIGARTLLSVKARGASHALLRLMFADRAMRYALNKNDRLYGPGWFARLFDVTALTLVNIDPRVSGTGAQP